MAAGPLVAKSEVRYWALQEHPKAPHHWEEPQTQIQSQISNPPNTPQRGPWPLFLTEALHHHVAVLLDLRLPTAGLGESLRLSAGPRLWAGPGFLARGVSAVSPGFGAFKSFEEFLEL